MIGSLRIIDASFATRLIFEGPLQDSCRHIVDQFTRQGDELIAPILWAYETATAVTRAVHIGELPGTNAEQTLASFRNLGIRLVAPDEQQDQLALGWTLRLKRMAAYDSYYLALAQTLRCDLWTTDRRLFNAANVSWVHLVESSP